MYRWEDNTIHDEPEPEVRYYDKPIDKDADLFSLKDWLDAVNSGSIMDYDGCGYWCKDGMQSSDEVFATDCEDADSVVFSWKLSFQQI